MIDRRLSFLALLAAFGCPASSRKPSSEPAARPALVSDSARTDVVGAGSTVRAHPGDVRFMQDMIGHHAQALVMTSLVPSRTRREDFQLLAERIAVSQRDEIARMQQWLRKHGESVPSDDVHAHHQGASAQPMPGMLTDEELASLRAASGSEFEKLFLRFMIRHHEGALQMVGTLFGTPGAGQPPEVYQFATDVDSDQRAEIARMRSLLASL